MANEELYMELKDYIFSYCGNHFRDIEKKAHRHLIATAKSKKGENVTAHKFIMKEEDLRENKEIGDLVSGGFESFKEIVVERIWNDHKDELELDLCPRCNRIARTP